MRKTTFSNFLLLITASLLLASCMGNKQSNDQQNDAVSDAADIPKEIVSEKVTYNDGNETLIGYLVYDKSITEKRPAVIVVPEWWGNNDYPQMRAGMLAELGYVALSADMYGNGKVVDNPKDAQNNAGKFYSDPSKMKTRMMAAYNYLNSNEKVENGKIAAIGYCFGGSVCLNSAAMGVPLNAIVSFHGGLQGFKSSSQMKNVHTLVCNGKADEFVSDKDIENFRQQMKSTDAPYDFKEYENATHAFTNPAATENGKKFNMPIAYNEKADKQSWNDMLDFFKKHFPVND
jgi:dienelactone hydrolase